MDLHTSHDCIALTFPVFTKILAASTASLMMVPIVRAFCPRIEIPRDSLAMRAIATPSCHLGWGLPMFIRVPVRPLNKLFRVPLAFWLFSGTTGALLPQPRPAMELQQSSTEMVVALTSRNMVFPIDDSFAPKIEP